MVPNAPKEGTQKDSKNRGDNDSTLREGMAGEKNIPRAQVQAPRTKDGSQHHSAARSRMAPKKRDGSYRYSALHTRLFGQKRNITPQDSTPQNDTGCIHNPASSSSMAAKEKFGCNKDPTPYARNACKEQHDGGGESKAPSGSFLSSISHPETSVETEECFRGAGGAQKYCRVDDRAT